MGNNLVIPYLFKEDKENKENKEKPKLYDTLTEATIATEGLIKGQTPLRDENLSKGGRATSRFKDTVQGYPIDWQAWESAPADRKNFYYVAEQDKPSVIKQQYKNYINNPKGYGLTQDSTLEDVIKTFDKQAPVNKINYLKKLNIDIQTKIKDIPKTFNLSSINPFHVDEAVAAETDSKIVDNLFSSDKDNNVITGLFDDMDTPTLSAPKSPDSYRGVTKTEQKTLDLKRELDLRREFPVDYSGPTKQGRLGAFVEGIVPTEQGQTTRELYPGAYTVGKMVQIGLLSQLTGGIAPAVSRGLWNTTGLIAPKAIPVVAGAAQRAVTWGAGGIIDSIGKSDKYEDFVKNVSGETLFGVLTGGVHGIESTPTRIITGGITRGGYAAIKDLMDEGFDNQSLTNVLLSSALGVFFESINAPAVSRVLKMNRFNESSFQIALAKAKGRGAQDPMLSAILETKGLGIKPSPAIVMSAKDLKIPTNIGLLDTAKQVGYGQKVIEATRKGMDIKSAISFATEWLQKATPDIKLSFPSDTDKETTPANALEAKTGGIPIAPAPKTQPEGAQVAKTPISEVVAQPTGEGKVEGLQAEAVKYKSAKSFVNVKFNEWFKSLPLDEKNRIGNDVDARMKKFNELTAELTPIYNSAREIKPKTRTLHTATEGTQKEAMLNAGKFIWKDSNLTYEKGTVWSGNEGANVDQMIERLKFRANLPDRYKDDPELVKSSQEATRLLHELKMNAKGFTNYQEMFKLSQPSQVKPVDMPSNIHDSNLFPQPTGEAIEKPLAQASIEPKEPTRKTTPTLQKLKTAGQIKREARKQALKEKMDEIKDTGIAKDLIKEQIRQRRFNLNVGTYETNLFVNELDRTLTKQQKEVLPFLIEGTDVPDALGRPDLKDIYNKDKSKLAPVVAQVKSHFDEGWKKLQANLDTLSANQIEDYVTHIWDIPKSKKADITNWFTTQNRFLKKRYIDTLKEGIEKYGLKPKNLDITDIIRIHDIATNRAVENKKFVDWLSDLKTAEGTPLIAPSHLAPVDWVSIHHPALQKKLFIPGQEKLGEKISNELQDLLTEMGVAIGRRISPVVFGKPSQVGGLYVHSAPPEIRLQRFFETSTLAHEIGHHIDNVMKLGDNFLSRHKDELYTINKDRINRLKNVKGKYGSQYAESTPEQIAEFFALLFTDAKKSMKLAPSATEEILQRLNNDEVLGKLVDFDFAAKAKNLIGESAGMLINIPLKVHPDLYDPLRVIFDTRITHPAISVFEGANAYLKKATLSLSLFHPVALTEASIATIGPIKTLQLLSPVKIYKALVKNELPVYKDELIAREWVKLGLQIGATVDIPVGRIQKNLNDIAFKTKNVPLINKMAEFTALMNEGWDKLLWDYYQSSLKLYGAEHLSRHIDPTKDIAIQKREIAQLINDTYGGQNWEALMMGPKSVQFLTWGLLSADWTVSALIRQPMAPTGAGALYKEGRKLRRKLGAMFWIKAALYFGIGMNLLNALNRKDDVKRNPQYYEKENMPKNFWDYTMAGNAIGRRTHLFAGRYPDGKERYIRWGKQFRELPEMIFDDMEISPISATLKKLGGKTSPVIQNAVAIATGVSPSGYTQRDIYGKQGWERVAGSLKMLAKSPIPFSMRSILNADKEFYITDLAMPSSAGMTNYRAIQLFKIGIEKYRKSGDDRIVKEVYQDAVKNNLPAYTLYKSALTTLKAEETKNLNSVNKSIEDIDKALKKETDHKIINKLYRRKNRLKKEDAMKKEGLLRMGYALKELEFEYRD